MKKLLFLFFTISFYTHNSFAMVGPTVYRIEARLRRYRRKPTNLVETRIFDAENRETALAALKQYTEEHTYKNYRILWEGPVTVD